MIYLVSRLNYPQIWTELHLIEEFIPPAVQMSNRAFYMIMMKASCEYLLNLSLENMSDTVSQNHNNSILNELDITIGGSSRPARTDGNESPDRQRKLDRAPAGKRLDSLLENSPKRKKIVSFFQKHNKKLPQQNKSLFKRVSETPVKDTNKSNDLNSSRNTDAFFFDENCILQDDLIEKNANTKLRQHMMTMIEVGKENNSNKYYV